MQKQQVVAEIDALMQMAQKLDVEVLQNREIHFGLAKFIGRCRLLKQALAGMPDQTEIGNPQSQEIRREKVPVMVLDEKGEQREATPEELVAIASIPLRNPPAMPVELEGEERI